MVKVIDYIQKFLFLVFLIIFPFFFLPFTPEYYMTHKFYLIATMALILSALSIVKVVATGKLTIKNIPFGKLIFLLLMARLISLVFMSPNKIQALTSLPFSIGLLIGLCLLFFCIVSLLHHEKNETEIFPIMSIGGVILSVVIAFLFVQPFRDATLPAGLEFLKNPFFNPAGSHYEAMYFLGFILVYSIVSLIYNKKSRSALTFTALATSFVALVLTGYIIVTSKNEALFRLPPTTASWYASVETLKNWKTAILGIGPDNYGVLYTVVKPRSYNQTDLWQLNFNQSRSAILHIWAETGLIGLLAMLLIIGAVIRELLWLKEKKDPHVNMYTALGIYLGILLAAFPVSITVLTLMTIYLAALAVTVLKHEEGFLHLEDISILSGFTGKSHVTIDLKKHLVVMVLLIVVGFTGLGFLGFGAIKAYTAERYVKLSIDGLRNNKAADVYNNQLQAIRLNPYIEAYHIRFSQINLVLANNIAAKKKLSDQDRQSITQLSQQAINEAKKAVQLNPAKVANWANLAVTYRNLINVAKGADAWTISAFQRAILLDPNNPNLRLNLGGVYYGLKNYQQASQLMSEAIRLKPDWPNAHYNLAWALFQGKQYDQAVSAMQNVTKLIKDKNSENYKLAEKNLEEFKKKLPAPTEASQSAQLNNEVLTNPQQPTNIPLSPAIELKD